MKDLAESNRELASAMRNYAGVMQGIADKNPTHIVAAPQITNNAADAGPTPEAAKEKGKGGRKSQADKDAAAKADTKAQAGAAADADPFAADTNGADEPDPFGSDEPAAAAAPALTAEAIRGLIIRVKNEKGEAAAKKVLAHVGVATLSQIKEADYQKVVDFCARGGVKL
jgi:hypothetical protein